MKEESHISVSYSNSLTEGSCNGCNRYTGPNGVERHHVTIIHTRYPSIRFCPICLNELIERLSAIKQSVKEVSRE